MIGKRKICLEVKKIGIKDLESHAGHVKSFCENKNFDLGIATDGKRWEFVIFKDGVFCEDETFDINKDSKVLLEYFNRYLSN